ncbi:MAG: Asp-tRNA(Asn)/Glu-tRNA(Gln) amidotransferase subunit GatC [Candidatus Omnitrophica bacterium]|nr:Asp-tRNA(Asn)/Glu-tRNA(Gln) amidotransferase subunit GatC [Candidatus Omnitrophota bacterium]
MKQKKIIDRAIVIKIAGLSRLELSDAEAASYGSELAEILNYIAVLNEADVKGVQPTCHPLAALKNVFRKDTVRKPLPADVALSNAPDRKDNFFKVPKIITEP